MTERVVLDEVTFGASAGEPSPPAPTILEQLLSLGAALALVAVAVQVVKAVPGKK